MKWYKHLTASGDDPDIHDSIEIFGPEGYYVFFRTLEIMSIEFDIENPGKNTFSRSFLMKKFQVSARKVSKILQFFNEKERIFCEFYNNGKMDMVSLNCPKLKELADDYTRKELARLSG